MAAARIIQRGFGARQLINLEPASIKLITSLTLITHFWLARVAVGKNLQKSNFSKAIWVRLSLE